MCSNQLSYGPILVERTADVLLKKAGVVRYPKNRERETWTAQLVILSVHSLNEHLCSVLRFDGHLTGAIYVLISVIKMSGNP